MNLNSRLATWLTAAAVPRTIPAFVGRTCFHALPALELERRGRPTGTFDPAWVEASLGLLREYRDCQDFAMAGLVRMVMRYPASPWLAQGGLRGRIEEALLNAKYWDDQPGPNQCAWGTENHQALFASAEYLVGMHFPEQRFGIDDRPGLAHAMAARERLERWLDWRLRFGFSEWNSSCYLDEDAAALLNLVEHASHADLRERVEQVLILLLMQVATMTWKRGTVGSQGRAYLADVVAPDLTPVACLAGLLWGEIMPVPPKEPVLACQLMACGDWRPPAILARLGAASGRPRVERQRVSLDAEEAASWGVDPAHLAHYDFFRGAGLDRHHLVVDAGWTWMNGKELWGGYFAARDWYTRCRVEGRAFDPHCLPHALSRADLLDCRGEHWHLGSALDWRAGQPGYQQLVWSASLGGRAVCFTTNPAPANVPYGRPGPWVGNGMLPRVLQHRNILVCLHRVRPRPVYDQPSWYCEPRSHAYLPWAAFDEVVEVGGWCLARRGLGALAIRPTAEAQWRDADAALIAAGTPPGRAEWMVESADCVWLVACTDLPNVAAFADWVRDVTRARVSGGVEELQWESPLGVVEAGWEIPFKVDGELVPLRGDMRFDGPFCQSRFGSRSHRLAIDGEVLNIGNRG